MTKTVGLPLLQGEEGRKKGGSRSAQAKEGVYRLPRGLCGEEEEVQCAERKKKGWMEDERGWTGGWF